MENKKALIYGFSAYFLWGVFPLYFKMITEIPPIDILCHRIIWSFVFLALILAVKAEFLEIKKLFQQPRKIVLLSCTSFLIALNWGTYIWAVNNDHMLDASLGYFINPLVSVCLGMFFLKERLVGKQWLSILLAVIGVVVQIVEVGSLSWVATILALSFAFYGLLRKKANVSAETGLFLETIVLLPIAFIYLFFISTDPAVDLTQNSWKLNTILLSAGIITTVPLLLFNAAATKISLSILGFMQYIAPSMVFLMAIFLYHESLKLPTLVTFAFIWVALVIYTLEAIKGMKSKEKNK